MKANEIKKGIYWVGAIDWELQSFHGYTTPRGSTYNAYLVIDEKITLIDTVKSGFTAELISRISDVIDPAKIDYIITNHVEMDHSGSLPAILSIAKNATVVTSAAGKRGLEAHFDCTDWKFEVVKGTDTLNTGVHTFQFVPTPMVHWPDNMLTYLADEELLFSNDSLGQHLACSQRFDDEISLDIALEEAARYYANIVLPYSAQVQKELEVASTLKLSMIAPSHGIIWRKHIASIVAEYQKWSQNQTKKKAVVVYDSMWHSTEKMAHAIVDAFETKGYEVAFFKADVVNNAEIMHQFLDAEYICVGSPTLNNNMLPTISAFLTYLKGLTPKNRKAIAFGSYGWGGQSIGQVATVLEESGFTVVDSIKHGFVPTESDLRQLTQQVEGKI